MLKSHCDEILENDDVIVGLGDSFTQGIGAYSLDTWRNIPKNPNIYNISGNYFRDEQAVNNWVRQLRDNFLPNYKVYNLGINGGGNRAAINELYLNPLPKKIGNVIVILMATSIDRFDFCKKPEYDNTTGDNWHQKWQTIFPTLSNRGPISKLEELYFRLIWANRCDAFEFLINIVNIQNYCKANNFKFLFASAFDSLIHPTQIKHLLGNKSKYIDIVDWNNFIKLKDSHSFIDMLQKFESDQSESLNQLFVRNSRRTMPTRYITPCSHWTIEGHFKVAEYLFKTIKKRGLI